MNSDFYPSSVPDHHTVRYFCTLLPNALRELRADLRLSLTEEGLLFTQSYFRDAVRRDPTVGELRFLDRYARMTALSPEAKAVSGVRFTKEDDLRVWKDICRKQKELAEGNAVSPLTVSEILRISGKHLERSGCRPAFPALRLDHACALAAEGASPSPASNALAATLHERHMPPAVPGAPLLLWKSRNANCSPEEITALLRQHPTELQAVRFIGPEGIAAHLLSLGGLDLDAISLLPQNPESVLDTLQAVTANTVLLQAASPSLPTLLAAHPELTLLGRTLSDEQILIRRGITPLCGFSHDFLKHWHQRFGTALHVPAPPLPPAATSAVYTENDTLLGIVTATARALPAMLSLIRKLFLQGARFTTCTITATLTLPDGTEETLGEALPLVLDYHRVTSELALPGRNEAVRCDAVAAPALTVAGAAQKGSLPSVSACEALDAAIQNRSFADFRKVLFEIS